MYTEGSINFAREVFKHPYNLIALVVGGASSVALSTSFPDLGIALLSGLMGAELMYLGIATKLPEVRRKIELKKIQERYHTNNNKAIFQSLDQASQKRFLVSKHLTKLIAENFDKLPYTSQGLLNTISKKLDTLLTNHLNLLDLIRRYTVFLNVQVEKQIESELVQLINHIKTLDPGKLKDSKTRRITILQKRLKKFSAVEEKFAMCETHLETIEDAIRYIYEQSMTMNKPEEIGFQLDNLLTNVDETAELLDAMDLETYDGQPQEYYSEAQLDELLTQIQEKKARINEAEFNKKTSQNMDFSDHTTLNKESGTIGTSESTSLANSNSSAKKEMRQ